jgi:hypothetical protein
MSASAMGMFRILMFMFIFVSGKSFSLTCNDLNGAYLFSQETSPTYLGFFGNQSSPESIQNTIGIYGSTISPNSVRNELGKYGSEILPYSIRNPITPTPPAIYKHNARIGYLTNNTTSILGGVSLKTIDELSCSFSAVSKLDNAAHTQNTWDFDEDGNADALTDGLLLLRYAFNLRGATLTADAISSSSLLTPEEVAANVAEATNGLADIDGNGEVDALTDGLMLLRYLFNLRGNTLIADAVKNDAARISAIDIEAYILSLMPSQTESNLGQETGDNSNSDDATDESINIVLNEEGEIFGTADFYNSDFIKMNTFGAGQLIIEILPDDNQTDIDCGLTSDIGPSSFSNNNFITDDDNNVINNELFDSNCNLTAQFTEDRDFYLFIDIADESVGSVSYTVSYSFMQPDVTGDNSNSDDATDESINIVLNEEGEISGTADFYNSDFIKMNTFGAGQLIIEILPDDNQTDIDCGLTSDIGPSSFSNNNFITDDDNNVINNELFDSNCNLTAEFTDDRDFYLFIDIADESVGSVSYTVSYSFVQPDVT